MYFISSVEIIGEKKKTSCAESPFLRSASALELLDIWSILTLLSIDQLFLYTVLKSLTDFNAIFSLICLSY